MLSLPPPAPPYPSSSRHEYDVFLSFRGEDTRKTFTDHLFDALKRNGIHTFRDDPKLEAGEEISPELFKAIQVSWCSLIVFSKRYASSSWCLEELAEIVEQRNKRRHRIFPIFYDVDPSDLRKQTGKVEKAFAKHEERYKEDKDKIQRWRKALTEVANLKGWHLKNRHESEFIGDIVKKISEKLSLTYAAVPNGLIGIKSRLEELHSKIDIGEDDVRIIGICGMGGLGKTTLARVAYSQLSPKFEGKSFLAGVREVSGEQGLVSLQKQLLANIFLGEGFNLFNIVDEGKVMISHRLSHKKVLVVIDDVDNLQQLQCLVESHDWFGPGSRIIITTRDKHLLQTHRADAPFSGKFGVDDIYEPATLDFHEAHQLFNLKAFNTDTVPENDFKELSLQVVRYADGLPLALEVLGSFLCGRDTSQWRSAIERLRRDFDKGILERLQIGFDGLAETEKNIFLDIACFFNMAEKDFVIKILDGCEFSSGIGINVLVEKSLIQVVDNKYLRIHDLLQEMGRQIVKQKSPSEPGKRCRLWEEKEVYYVLTRNTATETIEGIVINKYNAGEPMYMEQDKMYTLISDALSKMKKLRLLRVSTDIYQQKSRVDLKYLSNDLRLLDWSGYPFRSLSSSFQADNLVALLIPDSHIERLWEENSPLSKLKLVNLKGSINLIKTADLTRATNLESLILEGCISMEEVHLGVLTKLKLLNFRGCKSLKRFSTKIEMKSLETLILSGCSKLQLFPKIDGEMKCLKELYLDGTGIKELPLSIGHLSNLVLLNLKDCRNLVSLLSNIDGCKRLKTLNLSGCSKLETLPENLQQLEFLEVLDLSETAIGRVPSFIFQFKNLKVLSLNGCKGPPSKLLPILRHLPNLLLRGSKNSTALMLPPLSGLSSLTELNLRGCNIRDEDIPKDICCLFSLKRLNLSGNNITRLPESLTQLSKLLLLNLSDCKRLKSLPYLQNGVKYVSVDGCASLVGIENPSTICNAFPPPNISAINCYRFAKNNNVLTMLKKQIKVNANTKPRFDIIIPGIEIPKWFSLKTDGDESSIRIQLHPDIWNDSQWMGLAMCSLFVYSFDDDDAWEQGVEEELNTVTYDTYTTENLCYRHRLGRELHPHRVKKDHLLLQYIPRDRILEYICGGMHRETKNFSSKISEKKNFVNMGLWPGHPLGERDRFAVVKKFGVRLVYKKDLEETEELQDIVDDDGSTGKDLEETEELQDIVDDDGSTGDGGVLVKRKRNIYEEAGPSDPSDSPEERPHPK